MERELDLGVLPPRNVVCLDRVRATDRLLLTLVVKAIHLAVIDGSLCGDKTAQAATRQIWVALSR